MLRFSSTFSLRHLLGVAAQSTSKNSVDRASRIVSDLHSHAEDHQEKFRVNQSIQGQQEADEAQKHLVSLRVGGAKVLAPAFRDILVQSEKSPLHFAPVRPRDAGLCQQLCMSLAKLKIRRLTELQGALVPELLRGKHVIGHAETGSGKSFGIALATCNRMLRHHTSNRLHTLILVPTDALALQYERWLRHFAGSSRQVVLAAVSQYPLEQQLSQLHNVQPHVLVGAPQRLSEIATLCPVIIGERLRAKVDCIVLDEADVLLKTPITPPTSEDAKTAERFNQELEQEQQQQHRHRSRLITGGLGRQANPRNNDASSPGNMVLSCSELIDRLYRSEAMELPAQIVATSATFDGETASRLNTWMRNEGVTRLTTSIEEQALPPTLSFHFVAESPPQWPAHKLLKMMLNHIACQRKRPKILVFADPAETDLADLTRFISELQKYPTSLLPEERSAAVGDDDDDDETMQEAEADRKEQRRRQQQKSIDRSAKWKAVSLVADFEDSEGKHSELNDSSSLGYQQNTVNRKIFGRNGEIFSFNDTNLSKLETGREGTEIGVSSYELARGLHVAGVTHVIAYGTVPGATEFLHCAGRTGRRGKAGEVISIFPPSAGRTMKDICETLNIPWQTNRPSDVNKALNFSVQEKFH